MRKKVLFGIIAIVVIGALGAVVAYWPQLRGFKPVALPPPKDITTLVPPSTTPLTKTRPAQNTTGMPLKLPDGFFISIFAKDIPGARVMALDPQERMVVSLTSAGKVVVIAANSADSAAPAATTLLAGLNKPHGLAFRCGGIRAVLDCWLYVAETDKIVQYNYDADAPTPRASNPRKIAGLPSGSGHFTRTITFGADDRLYVSIGSSCNVCNEKDNRRAKIFSMKPDGSDFKEFARGLRNAVFFTWSPFDGRLWATDNGRDLLGDELPPDEINIVEQGKNYGWPLCYGKNVHDTNFDKNIHIRKPCTEPFEVSSHIDLPAHSAALGLAFVNGEGWPEEYKKNLFVAFHGSWNRTQPTGYKVVRIKLDAAGNYLGTEDFITGWLTGENKALGRPVDILTQADGVLYISDDKAGVIYKVERVKEN